LGDTSNFYYTWYSSEQTSFALQAISQYDKWRGNNIPNLQVLVSSDKIKIIDAIFESASTPPAENSLFFEELNPKRSVSFSAKGTGEASIVFGLNFVPLKLNSTPVYRGISIEKVIQKIDPTTLNPISGKLDKFQIGDRLKITIQITIPDDCYNIRIIDPLSSLYEALDENFIKVGDNNNNQYNGYIWWYYFNNFNHKEFHKDKVIFQSQYIFAGTHSVSYYAVVNTEGTFILPPAKVYDEKQPEVMGLSGGGSVSSSVSIPDFKPAEGGCINWEHKKLAGVIPGKFSIASSPIILGLLLLVVLLL